MIEPQLFAGLAIIAIASAIVGGIVVALFRPSNITSGQIEQIAEDAARRQQAEFARRGQRASTDAKKAKRSAQRQLVLDTAEQMRLDMAAKAKG